MTSSRARDVIREMESAPPDRDGKSGKPMHVVLVHGIFNTARMMSGLDKQLSAEGHVCFRPSLKPSDGRAGLEHLAHRLEDYIDSVLPRDTRLVVVGFSMGAMVCRCYLQLLGAHQRTDAFFSIAGPHGGTLTAYLYPGKGARDMRPGSSLIKSLEATADRLSEIPVVSYWCPIDTMIIPGGNARLAGSEQTRLRWAFHAALPFDRRVQRDICKRMKAIRPNRGLQQPTPVAHPADAGRPMPRRADGPGSASEYHR